MQTIVKLQPPFSYSKLNLVIVLVINIVIAIIMLYVFMRKNKKKEIPIQVHLADKADLPTIKQKYIEELYKLSKKLDENAITIRHAYQSLSSIIREFVYEATEIKVQNYTLKEIKKLNMPTLYELIREYYYPEFAQKSAGDIKNSIDKARMVIEKWN